jgi:hypothetical protein
LAEAEAAALNEQRRRAAAHRLSVDADPFATAEDRDEAAFLADEALGNGSDGSGGDGAPAVAPTPKAPLSRLGLHGTARYRVEAKAGVEVSNACTARQKLLSAQK